MDELVLRVVEGNAKGADLRVVDELLLGRSAGRPGNLENDPTLSRRHARLRLTADELLVLEDLGSHNGTYVNGRPVRTPVTLARGDRIEIGQTTLELVVLADPPPPEAEVTRYARPVPEPPVPVPADPQVTRLAEVPADPPPPPAADPQVTRLARVADEPPPPRVPAPQVPRLAEVPGPAPAPPDPQATRMARATEEVGGQPTRLAQVPVEPPPEVRDQPGEADAGPAPVGRRPWWKRLLRR